MEDSRTNAAHHQPGLWVERCVFYHHLHRESRTLFWEILDGKMNLSVVGHFAESCWFDIPNHFPFVELGEFVVIHGQNPQPGNEKIF